MVKKALLIGINYPGTAVELRGCVNDVHRMQRSLIDRFGFLEENITLLIDTDKSKPQPTGKNIRDFLNDLIRNGESGDTLVVHYSGHGTRLPSEHGVFDPTGFDECITPCDMNLILDNEFKQMVAQVKPGCKLTIITDSCHSGGLLEEVKEQIGNSYTKKRPKFTYLLSLLMNLFAICGISSSQKDSGGNAESFTKEQESKNGQIVDLTPRYLPVDTFKSILEQRTGQTNIEIENIRPTLIQLFGDDSSPVALSNSMKRTGHRGFFSTIFTKNEVNADGAKPKARNSNSEYGILLSGCQTDQRSEDVYVVKTGKAYGAFSDAIQTILWQTKKGEKITNRDVIMKAREILRQHNFNQRPGLYCHDRYVNAQFIC